ncbi:MAG: type II toxin-antitoxin system VapC family toxin [Desulfovermiculus sp.]
MIGIIDTSALLRLFVPDGAVPDGLEEFFHGVNQGQHCALAPQLLIAEAGNVIWKYMRSGILTSEEGKAIFQDIINMPVRLVGHKDLAKHSLDLAEKHNLTVYDSLFIALALEQGGVLFTADQKMLETAKLLHVNT